MFISFKYNPLCATVWLFFLLLNPYSLFPDRPGFVSLNVELLLLTSFFKL